jgi:hypothetical protein
MALTTLGAIALGTGVLGSAAISSGAAGRASKAATQAADQSAAVQREQFQANQRTLAPFVQTGNTASSSINALLGLNSGANETDFANYVRSNPDIMQGFEKDGAAFGNDLAQFGQFHWNKYGQNEGRELGNTAATQAQQGFDQFRNSTGYQFRLGEGMNALNSQFAGAGAIKSGAAMRGAVDYGQNLASNEFGNYLTALGNQQGVGLSAAGAQAGVGTNFANSMSQINSNRADAIGNAALANAGNLNSMIGTLGAGILKYGVK